MLDLSLAYNNHFLALAGKNPQIVTEALYCIMDKEHGGPTSAQE